VTTPQLNAGIIYASTFLIALVVVLVSTPLMIRLATHLGVIDQTGDARRVHTVPTPRIGGVAVFLGFAFALFTVLGFSLSSPFSLVPSAIHVNQAQQIDILTDQYENARKVVGLLFGGLLILGVGLWDDIMGMRPRNKLLAQIVVASIAMLYGFVIDGTTNPFNHNPNTNWIEFPWYVGVPLTLVWYVGMMNAINFIDGLDGLLSGVATISAVVIFVISILHTNPVVALIMMALAGSALGFLPYNFNPARIFLGDAGSLFIGFVFATVTIIGEGKQAIAMSLLVPLVVLALPILDTAAAIVRRAFAGKRIAEADRGHFHHQLIFRFGLNTRQAVLLIYAVCFVLGIVAVVLSGGFTHVFGRAT
jgi:UDP-GlcNAc:undecaprenyl-phosphate GlcNAc-1-phosphate transferase